VSVVLLNSKPRARVKSNAKKLPLNKTAKAKTYSLNAKTSDPELQHRLIEEHQQVAIKMAQTILKSWGAYLEEDEVSSICNLSLCEAAKMFKPAIGVKFSSFLFYYLKGNLIRSVSCCHKTKEFETTCGSAGELESHSLSSNSELCKNNVIDFSLAAISHDSQIPNVKYFKKQILTGLTEALGKLKDCELEIVQRYYFEGKSAREVAEELGKCRSNVIQTKNRALAKLRKSMLFSFFESPYELEAA